MSTIQNEYYGLDLTNAVIIGYFSLPSPSLAEHNPSAYQLAMSEVPRGLGAGSCDHCGTGILHHVIIRIGDKRHVIGHDCAQKVGNPRIRRCLRERITSEEFDRREAESAIRAAKWDADQAQAARERQATLDARFESLKDIITTLEAQGTEFHSSLASQLRVDSLSPRQAEFAAKAVAGRCTKKNTKQWEAVYDRCRAAAM